MNKSIFLDRDGVINKEKKDYVKNINELEIFFIEMKKKAKLESNFDKLKIKLNLNLDKILSGINVPRLKNNPIDLNIKDIKTILLKSN